MSGLSTTGTSMSEMPLDRAAVRAELEAADAPAPTFPPLPVQLTERELEVLQRLAVGRPPY